MLTPEAICGSDNDALFVACAAGHLAVAQWLWSLGLILGPREFVIACSNGHLAVAQWIWGLGLTPEAVVAYDVAHARKGVDAEWLRSVGL